MKRFALSLLLMSTVLHADYLDYFNERDNRNVYNTATYNPPYTTLDSRLQLDIQTKLSAGSWTAIGYNTSVSVDVVNGIVNLQGYVYSPEDRDRIERGVRLINGVKGVRSHIVIRFPPQPVKDREE
jgi:osmotically-inducible protein OsmY